jgi:uncharacterized protein
MPSGLAALLDDIATLTKVAAASLDDISLAAAKASTKAAGVVIDDTAVTPQYVTGFTADRELPIIWRIAKGSLKNKLVFILPAAIALSALLPQAITPLLMFGGAFLCFEGAEKVIHKLFAKKESLAEQVAEATDANHEETMVAGAIRTDFILSAEIMAIALKEVSSMSIPLQAAALVVVALGITTGVYGVVALIVKMDDIGLHLAQTGSRALQMLGRGLVQGMPKLLGLLAFIGTAAMLWVGAQIILHGFHIHFDHYLHIANPSLSWLADSSLSALCGILLGSAIVGVHHLVVRHKHA